MTQDEAAQPVAHEEPAPRERAELAAPESPLFSVALAVFGVLDAIAPYVSNALGLHLATLPLNEVVDHVVPGAIVVVVAWVSLVRGHRSLVGSLLCFVAGTWMVATHVPLLVQAGQGLVPLQTALLHSLPGILVLLTALMATVVDIVVATSSGTSETD